MLNGCDRDSGCDPAPGSPEEKCGDEGGSQKKVGDDHFRSVSMPSGRLEPPCHGDPGARDEVEAEQSHG